MSSRRLQIKGLLVRLRISSNRARHNDNILTVLDLRGIRPDTNKSLSINRMVLLFIDVQSNEVKSYAMVAE